MKIQMKEIPTGTYEVLPSAYQVVKVAGTIQIKDCCDNNNNKDENNENYDGGHERVTPKSRQTRSATRGRALIIDIHTSAGVNIVDERTYTFKWNKEEEEEKAGVAVTKNNGRGVNNDATTTTEEGTITTMLRNDTDNDTTNDSSNNNSTNQTRIGTLTLDDNVFGSKKRTILEPVRYDEQRQTLTVQALWTGKVSWFGSSSYSVHVPIRTVLQKQKSTTTTTTTTTKQSEEARMGTSSLPSPVLVSSSSSLLPSSSPLPLPLPLLIVQTEPAFSVSRYQVFDAYIRRTSEQCAF